MHSLSPSTSPPPRKQRGIRVHAEDILWDMEGEAAGGSSSQEVLDFDSLHHKRRRYSVNVTSRTTLYCIARYRSA